MHYCTLHHRCFILLIIIVILTSVSIIFHYNTSIVSNLLHPDHTGCSAKTWTEVDSLVTPSFVNLIEHECRLNDHQYTVGRSPDHPIYRRLQVINALLAKEGREKQQWLEFFEEVVKSTRVHVIIGSRDRPSLLSLVLQLFRARQLGQIQVSISFVSSSIVHAMAYAALSYEYPEYEFVKRASTAPSGYTPYSAFVETTLAHTNATNVAIFSDDTWLRVPTSFSAIGALQRILSTGRKPYRLQGRPYSLVVELRGRAGLGSMPTARGEVFSPEVLAFGSLKNGMIVYNTSNCPFISHQLPLCYNRHIDGPLYTIDTVRTELPKVDFNVVTHPAMLEAYWQHYRDNYDRNDGPDAFQLTTDDFVLAPIEQIAFNGGGAQMSVREESERGDRNSTFTVLDRIRASQAFVDGCRQNPLSEIAVEFALATSGTHREAPPLPWSCPK